VKKLSALSCLFAMLIIAFDSSSQGEAVAIKFNSDIRPILSGKCYSCGGPGTQEANLRGEPQSILDLYGPEVTHSGSFARNCLLARRMVERDVRFVQLFHRGWDHHVHLPVNLRGQCNDTDQPAAALIKDLKQRGLRDETLVIWGGEFGRTVFCQGTLTKNNYGRDHHSKCFSIWMAGGGIKGGISYGVTDDYSYNIIEDPVHVRDFNATILHQLGIDHERLTVNFRGLDQRLTGVEEAHVVEKILL